MRVSLLRFILLIIMVITLSFPQPPQYYFWESVILGEKLALALVLSATQRYGAPPQLLAAQVVLLLALMLQIKCRPYGEFILTVQPDGANWAQAAAPPHSQAACV